MGAWARGRQATYVSGTSETLAAPATEEWLDCVMLVAKPTGAVTFDHD